jgi:hypothetical protein
MPFSPAVQEEALVRSRRCCCLCHRFAGLYVNVHHIEQEAQGGSNGLDNAIVLCFDCHAEAGHYNLAHPLGKKYQPSELRRHRDDWWTYVAQNPAVPLPVAPVSVVPSRIDFPKEAGQANRYEIQINNKSDSVLYDLAIAVAVSEPAEGYDVEFEQIEPDPGPVINMGAIEAHFGMLRFDALDPLGRRAWFFFVRQVAPKTLYRIPLVVRAAGEPAAADLFANTMLMYFSGEPTPLIERPSTLDEGWTEYLVKVAVFDDFYWLGLSAGPVMAG